MDLHNAHWEAIYEPSWLLAPDESMAPWTAKEGDGHDDIPFLSHVPRKPKDLGGEIKDTADGESGAIIRIELALKYKRVRATTTVVPEFEEEWGSTSAQCMRLIKPWLKTRRCFGADAHFISVGSVEALLLNVTLFPCTIPFLFHFSDPHNLPPSGYVCVWGSEANGVSLPTEGGRGGLWFGERRLGDDDDEARRR